ncbi:MAG: glycosyltransferase family 2 protein, partial [Clostridiales bacterium]
MFNKTYVLITAAKNEESFIELTIQSVIKQTRMPLKWIIASDGSTDCTDEIVKRYEQNYDFIRLVQIKNSSERNFASKVHALNLGCDLLKGIEYDFIGILDADITFEPEYYEKLINEFESNPRLGLAGGELYDYYNGDVHKMINSEISVGNAIQFFRGECFSKIGSFVP